MSIYVFKLPDLGEGTVEAEIVEWYVEPGDEVIADQTVVDVMTDKATVDVPTPVSGTVVRIAGEPGDMISVGSELFAVETGSEDSRSRKPSPPAKPAAADTPASAPPAEAEAAPPEDAAEPEPELESEVAEPDLDAQAEKADPAPEKKQIQPETTPAEKLERDSSERRILTSPAVRRHAQEAGVSLTDVPGSGPNGRILMQDLTDYLERSDTPAGSQAGQAAGTADETSSTTTKSEATDFSETKIIGVRRVIAERLSASKREIPHFAYVEEVDVTELEVLRKHLNERHHTSLSVLPFISLALLRSIPEHAKCNAHYDADAGVLRQFTGVNLGVAAQTDDGLKVPVVHNAQTLNLWQLGEAISRVAELARSGKAKPNDMTGSTITITSLGKLGGLVSTPIINRPEVAIIGVNKLTEKLTLVDGNVNARTVLNLSSSFDHRFIDGYDAAALIQAIKEKLEHPATLFLDPPA